MLELWKCGIGVKRDKRDLFTRKLKEETVLTSILGGKRQELSSQKSWHHHSHKAFLEECILRLC